MINRRFALSTITRLVVKTYVGCVCGGGRRWGGGALRCDTGENVEGGWRGERGEGQKQRSEQVHCIYDEVFEPSLGQ